jgi:hypothetical protein
MHLAEISLNPTQHNRSIELSFEIGTTRRNPCMHATLVKKSHLGKLKVALICTCLSPKPTVQANKECRISVNSTYLDITCHHTFYNCLYNYDLFFFSKILAQNEGSVVSNVFAKNGRKFKNIKNPLVFYIFPSKTSKKP